jgi:hypothetical protein
MTKPSIVLVHSPFVGPSSWAGVVGALRQRGLVTTAPSLASVIAGPPPYYSAIGEAVAKAALSRDAVLVMHSGAGRFLDTIAERASVSAAIFADAVLPLPNSSWLSTLPEDFRGRMLANARNGALPPWHAWFPPSLLEDLIADPATRAAFMAETPAVPLAFAHEVAPPQSERRPTRCAYLRLSTAYDAEAQAAERMGWPAIRESWNHLAMITDAAGVADRLATLVDALMRAERKG